MSGSESGSEDGPDEDGRFVVTRGGERRYRLMKGLELTRRRLAYLVVGIVFLFFVPDISNFTPLSFRAVAHGLMFGTAAVGLNLILRHTREVSFGHAAFFGTGAYATAILATHLKVTSGFVLLVGALVASTLMAAVIGFLTLRHRGIYFALLTLAFGQLLYALALGFEYLGGADGLPVRPGSANKVHLFGILFPSEVYTPLVYYITVIFVLLSLLVMLRIVKSPFGRALDAIGQDRTRAEFIGIPVTRYTWIAFVISGVYGGLAGGLFGLFQEYIRPGRTLFFFRSGEILFMAILGGFETLLGPLVGGIVLVYLLQSMRFFTEYFNFMTGVVLLAVVYFFPEGVVGSIQEGGALRLRLRELRSDPAVVTDWGSGAVTAARRSLGQLKYIIFGSR